MDARRWIARRSTHSWGNPHRQTFITRRACGPTSNSSPCAAEFLPFRPSRNPQIDKEKKRRMDGKKSADLTLAVLSGSTVTTSTVSPVAMVSFFHESIVQVPSKSFRSATALLQLGHCDLEPRKFRVSYRRIFFRIWPNTAASDHLSGRCPLYPPKADVSTGRRHVR